MPKLTIGQKAERVLQLLIGLRNVRIAEALAAFGFTEEDRNEGWQHLQNLTANRLGVQARAPDPTIFQRLDAWENQWFPITRASLRHRYPKVHERVFANLRQTDGLEVVVSVGTFVTRIRELPQSGIEDAVTAHALLEKRGLNDATLGEAETMLQRVRETAAPSEGVEEQTAEQRQAAEDALWAWYLEWSAIARAVIHDGNLLRSLGFRPKRGSRPGSSQDDELEPGDNDPEDNDAQNDEVQAQA